MARSEIKTALSARYRCTKCGKTFSESQPLDGVRLDSEKAAQIVHLLCEGVGIRAISRLADIHQQTVLNTLGSAGIQYAALLNAKLRNLRPGHVECDEIWTFVQKKQYHSVNHPIFGGQYCSLSIDQSTKLIINFQIAKRTKEAAMQFMVDLRSRVADTVFAPPICTSCKRTLRTGGRITASITVNHAERQNLNIPVFNRRFTRLTLGFSKKLANLEHSIALTVAYHNFCRTHKSLHKKGIDGQSGENWTPAMAAGLTGHPWIQWRNCWQQQSNRALSA